MNAVAVPYGVRLLYDAGILPPNPKRAALAEASPEELATIGRDQLALQTTATLMVLDQDTPDTSDLSPGAMQTILSAMAAPSSAAPTLPAPQTDVPELTGAAADQHAKSSATGVIINVLA